MSQGAEGYVQIIPDSTGKYIRNITFLESGPDGVMRQVQAQIVCIADPMTGQPVRPMSNDQADTIISLLKRIAKQLENGR